MDHATMRGAAKASTSRYSSIAVCLAMACSLAACSSDGDGDDDSAPVAAPVAGTAVGGNPMATVPDDGSMGVPANDPSGLGGPVAGAPVAGGAPIGGTGPAPVGGGAGSAPAATEGTFQCGTINITIDAGDTVTCEGVVYQLNAAGDVVPVDGNVPAGGAPTGGVATGGGFGDGGSVGGAVGGSVASSLVNRFTDDNNFEFWGCESGAQADGLDFIGYAFGEGTGTWFAFMTDGNYQELGFTWQPTAADSIILNFDNGDTAEDITTIAFSDSDAWTGDSSYFGGLSCSIGTFAN